MHSLLLYLVNTYVHWDLHNLSDCLYNIHTNAVYPAYSILHDKYPQIKTFHPPDYNTVRSDNKAPSSHHSVRQYNKSHFRMCFLQHLLSLQSLHSGKTHLLFHLLSEDWWYCPEHPCYTHNTQDHCLYTFGFL